MKILGNEIKPGMIIEHNNDLWTVLKAVDSEVPLLLSLPLVPSTQYVV